MSSRNNGNNFIEMEFIAWLLIMMRANKDFKNIRLGSLLDTEVQHPKTGQTFRPRADILCQYKGKEIIIETRLSAPLTSGRVTAEIKRLEILKSASPLSLVFVVPDAMQQAYKDMFTQESVETWDTPVLAGIFKNELELIKDTPLYNILIGSAPTSTNDPSIEEQLIIQLQQIKPGKLQWSDYQKLCADILAHLFVPPLSKPLPELSDYTKTNRRDIIFPNNAEEKFWLFMRQEYRAHYVIVDAKNYSKDIPKGTVLQMSNYLREFGAGLFGIICCRTNPRADSVVTQREQWIMHHKLILFLNDKDLIQMLTSKKNNENPEKVIQQKIAEFRLSL